MEINLIKIFVVFEPIFTVTFTTSKQTGLDSLVQMSKGNF